MFYFNWNWVIFFLFNCIWDIKINWPFLSVPVDWASARLTVNTTNGYIWSLLLLHVFHEPLCSVCNDYVYKQLVWNEDSVLKFVMVHVDSGFLKKFNYLIIYMDVYTCACPFIQGCFVMVEVFRSELIYLHLNAYWFIPYRFSNIQQFCGYIKQLPSLEDKMCKVKKVNPTRKFKDGDAVLVFNFSFTYLAWFTELSHWSYRYNLLSPCFCVQF